MKVLKSSRIEQKINHNVKKYMYNMYDYYSDERAVQIYAAKCWPGNVQNNHSI